MNRASATNTSGTSSTSGNTSGTTSGYFQGSPYMTPYSGSTPQGGGPQGVNYPPPGPPTSLASSGDQIGTNNSNLGFTHASSGGPGGQYLGNSPSIEDAPNYYGQGSSPRDLSYYGFNNGFGGDSAGAFYHQNNQQNNNKVSSADIKNEPVKEEATDQTESDISDNQKSRSQPSPQQDSVNLPRTSPASHESSEFETQTSSQHFDMINPHEEYLRQQMQSGMAGQPEAGLPPYGLPMQYGGQPNHQQQMWDNYYNYPGQQQQHMHNMQQQQILDYGMPAADNNWWTQQQQQQQQMMSPGVGSSGQNQQRPDYSSNFRAPPIQSPGSWMLRGPRPRNDRRGPGRPRIGPGSAPSLGKANSPGSESRLLRPQLMSPPPGGGSSGSFSPFPTDMGSPSPAGASDATPGSPSPSGFDPHVPIVPSPPVAVGSPATSGDPSAVSTVGSTGKTGSSKAANANKKRYHCEICGKKFSTAWYVRVHRKSHSGERPYICHNCGKGFMLPNVLQVHLRKCDKNNPAGPGANNAPSKANRSNGPQVPQAPPVVLDHNDHSQEGGPGPVGMPQSSPALPQQGFLGSSENQYNNGGPVGPAGYNQRYEMGIPGGMPTPPFHGMGGNQGNEPMFEPHQFGLPNEMQYGGQQGGPYVPTSSNVPAHFLANDRPPDEGGGFLRACEMCDKGPCPLHKAYACTFCDKRFTLKAMFDAHVKSHLRGPAGIEGGFTELPPSPSFSPGIPTPQSSLDSLSCFGVKNTQGGLPLGKDPLSELQASVDGVQPESLIT